jgi:hypothetical protein
MTRWYFAIRILQHLHHLENNTLKIKLQIRTLQYCLLTYMSESILLTLLYVRVNTAYSLICQSQYCLLTYLSESILLTHLYVRVNTAYSLTCQSQYCLLTYLSESILLTHLYIRINTAYSLICQSQYCLLTYMSESILLTHLYVRVDTYEQYLHDHIISQREEFSSHEIGLTFLLFFY